MHLTEKNYYTMTLINTGFPGYSPRPLALVFLVVDVTASSLSMIRALACAQARSFTRNLHTVLALVS